MAVNLTRHIERLGAQLRDQQFDSAAEAMAGSLRAATSSYLGGMSFSGGAGTATLTPVTGAGRLAVTSGGAYALADKGRRRNVGTIRPGGRALRTPWGPRATVRGSTWGGFGITDGHGREAIRVGIAAVIADVDWGR